MKATYDIRRTALELMTCGCLVMLALINGCSGNRSSSSSTGSSGGSGTGGTAAMGSAPASDGSTSPSATGGSSTSAATGGIGAGAGSNSGGQPGTGGLSPAGGTSYSGGAHSTGGSYSAAGNVGTGGAVALGGTSASTGGSKTSGGSAAIGGSKSTGGQSATGGLSATGGATSTSSACGVGDANLPAEPTLLAACATLQASQNVAANALPSESSLDTSRIQTALNSCSTGMALRLTTGGGNNSFMTGPLTIPTGVSLWVDTGATLFGTRDPNVYGSATALITAKGANSGIMGDGIIDGQGGEPMIGGSGSFWDQNGGGGSSPALIQVSGATNFTLYRITLHNAPMFHVKLNAAGFVAWGVTVKAPTKTTNSAGTALNYTNAHNTDGIDPGEAASNGYIVCCSISTGDDHIAIKGNSGVKHLTIAHNHFGAGHGMSIGSEFTGGVSDINVYDLSIDGMSMGTSGGSSNGIRIKSDSSRGGLVNNVTYSDVCVRNLSNPILLTPFYSTATGADIPQFTNVTIRNFHGLSGGSNTPKVTLNGYDAAHLNSVTLDNVVIDGISASNVTGSYTNVTLGPGNVNFTPSGTGLTVADNQSGTSTPNPCTNKWVTF